MVVLKRQAGFLLAVPRGFIPQQVLDRANQGVDGGPIGPSTVGEVPAVLVEDGMRSPTGTNVGVVIVDMIDEMVAQLRRVEEAETIAVPFDPDSIFNLPSPTDLLRLAKDWISAAGEETGLGFYTATGGESPVEETDRDLEVNTPPRRTKRAPRVAATPTGSGVAPKAKKPTTASLAASMEQLLEVVPSLSTQIQDLAQRHQVLENRLVAPSRAGALGLSQPFPLHWLKNQFQPAQ